MPILFFLPWATCHERIDFSRFSLLPYVRGELPGSSIGTLQDVVDAVLGSYGDPDFFPSTASTKHLQSATLIDWKDDGVGADLDDDKILERLTQLRYVSFSALAERRFCGHSGYCNADGYQAVAQRFSADSPGSTAISTRRRDGHGLHYVGTAFTPRFIRPDHVNANLRIDLDASLVEALLQLPDGLVKRRFDDSIAAYLNANTDSSAVLERTEMVSMRVAFETLLEARHESSDLRKRFAQHFSNDLPAKATWSPGEVSEAVWRARWKSNVNRPLDAWVQDFCASRNSAAHGGGGEQHERTVWPRHNHLLFTSMLFPLMVKQALADMGLYAISDRDRASRGGFEVFLGHDLLGKVEEDKPELWWSRVERGLLFAICWNEVFGRNVESDVDPDGDAHPHPD